MNSGFTALSHSPLVEAFARQRYAVVRGLVGAADAARYWAHLENVHAQGLTYFNDPQVPQTPSIYGDLEMEKLLATLGRQLEFLTALQLYPTYSYARLYKKGDELKQHRDRPACEVSVSINLGQKPDIPWPLYLRDTNDAVIAVNLKPGDALLYRGIELTHWREPYAGERMAQVFLHYVERNGFYAGEKFDRREGLGQTAVQR